MLYFQKKVSPINHYQIWYTKLQSKHLTIFQYRKSTAIHRLKEDKVTKDQGKPASPGRPSSRTGLSFAAAHNKEKEELRAIIRNLEEKLKGTQLVKLWKYSSE